MTVVLIVKLFLVILAIGLHLVGVAVAVGVLMMFVPREEQKNETKSTRQLLY